jgi:protein phosphatase
MSTTPNGRALPVPELSLIALIGVTGSGKSTFARTHFRPTEVLSSDFFRGLVSDDENDQSVSAVAFDALYYIAGKRLAAGRRVVVDATNVRAEDRAKIVQLARGHDVLPVAIVLDVPEEVCAARNAARPDRDMSPHVISRMARDLRRGMRGLAREGFRTVHVLRGVDEIAAATITYERLFNDRRELTGPFDVIGDVHGCRSELESLLDTLGYHVVRDDTGRAVDAVPADGRTAVFVGDLVDRGPDTPGVLRLVMGMVANGHALCVSGNHENKLLRARRGRDVRVAHGLAESLEQLAAQEPAFLADVDRFLDGLISHYVLDGGRLVVAHAGLKEAYHGRASGRVRSFALYGDTTGETDEYGLPVRYPWANEYRGRATVVYGHTPTVTPEWVNNTMCVDTGCVFGGRLTALRYPEREIVSVAAQQVWYEPAKPFGAPSRPDPVALDIADVLGKRVVETAYHGRVSVREENAAAAIEVMSRFAVDPRWLVYLPPTMAPPNTSARADVLEHPDEAFGYFRNAGVDRVVCEDKHMGSRAVVVVTAAEEVGARRFAVTNGSTGAVYTRTGRPFFADVDTTERLLADVRSAIDEAGLWTDLGVDWLVLDAELLPWSAKAGDLLRNLYATVGAAARAALPDAVAALSAAAERGQDVADLLAATVRRADNATAFTTAYGRYCWPTNSLDGVRLAPFQLLAAGGENYAAGGENYAAGGENYAAGGENYAATRDHGWQLGVIDRLVAAAPERFTATDRRVVDLADERSCAEAATWWELRTAAGGEGMVVKPYAGLVRGSHGLVQPGVKCRGREYLRIIYGPDYTEPANLDRLRDRGVGRKRALALREYALGLEALDRFVKHEPLWRVHEAVFAVLALESEAVDPRL